MSIAAKNLAPKQAARELAQVVSQIDFNSEHYYNLYFESEDAWEQAAPAVEAWTNVSDAVADIAKLRGELARLRLGVEQIKMPAIEAVGLDRVADQLRSVEARIRPLAQQTDPQGDKPVRRLLNDLLQVVDTLDRVFGLAEDVWNTLPKGIGAGLESVHRLLLDTLAKQGLTKMEVEPGGAFDPHCHMAMGTEPEPGLSNGVVKYVMLPGYMLGEQILRTAQVVVVNNAS